MKDIIIGIITGAFVVSSCIPVCLVSAETADQTITPGIEDWRNPSGVIRQIEGVDFNDFIKSFGEDVYIYSDSKNVVLVEPDGKKHHFSTTNVWNRKYSVVKMRAGVEPPVKEINDLIGDGEHLAVTFYRYPDTDEYRFLDLNEEEHEKVIELLKNYSDVISIENRSEITEDVFRFEQLIVSNDIDPEQFIKDYPELDLSLETGENGVQAKSGEKYFKFNEYAASHELYDALVRLDKSGIEYEIWPLKALSSGSVCAEMVDVLYSADEYIVGDVNSDSTIDVTDLTDLSLALIGDKELTAAGQKAADIDGDGAVTLADLARLQQYFSKKIDSLR